MVPWQGCPLQGFLELDEVQGGSTGASWHHTWVLDRKGHVGNGASSSWLYSALERQKRHTRGGEAAFQCWWKFSHPEPRLREGEGRLRERRRRCTRVTLEKSPSSPAAAQRGQLAQTLPAPWARGMVRQP